VTPIFFQRPAQRLGWENDNVALTLRGGDRRSPLATRLMAPVTECRGYGGGQDASAILAFERAVVRYCRIAFAGSARCAYSANGDGVHTNGCLPWRSIARGIVVDVRYRNEPSVVCWPIGIGTRSGTDCGLKDPYGLDRCDQKP